MELHIFFGPTATSKTKVAQAFWDKFHYPILSVDSRKVYKYADIGTNKLSLLAFKEKEPRALVGGIDFLQPTEQVSAYVYQQYVYQWISDYREEVTKAGGLIIHGGTGLYLDAILEGKSLLSPENTELRTELGNLTLEQLQQRAEKENPAGYSNMNDSDQKNPRRLIRVVENKELRHKSEIDDSPSARLLIDAKKFWHISIPKREELYPIINKRVYTYIKQGWLEEVHQLLQKYGENAPALQVMGYKQIVRFIQENDEWQALAENNMPTFTSVIETIQQEHRHYSKRQETWAKKYMPLI